LTNIDIPNGIYPTLINDTEEEWVEKIWQTLNFVVFINNNNYKRLSKNGDRFFLTIIVSKDY
jgi:hypothetical protein